METLTNPDRVTYKKPSNIFGKIHCQFWFTLCRLNLSLSKKKIAREIWCKRKKINWATQLDLKKKAKRKRITRKKDQNRFAKRKERKTNPIFGCSEKQKKQLLINPISRKICPYCCKLNSFLILVIPMLIGETSSPRKTIWRKLRFFRYSLAVAKGFSKIQNKVCYLRHSLQVKAHCCLTPA